MTEGAGAAPGCPTDGDPTAAPPTAAAAPPTDSDPTAAGPTAASPAAAEHEAVLRTRLGLRPLRLDPTARLWGWLGPLAVTALAAVMRLVSLNHPSRLIFDETYYVKQAWSLLTLGYEGEWAEDADTRFITGDTSDLSTTADYVVHPAVGKWMIAVGLRLFGTDNGTGWRFSGAVVGTLSVLLLARVATRVFGSALLGTVAGLLLAVDGLHLTESRTGLLDIFLQFWVLVGFWCVLRDREASRAVLARRHATELAAAADPRRDRSPHPWGPRLGVRWWLVAAGVALGLATGVKWSGIYAVAVLGVMVFAWDTAARRAVGVRHWVTGGVARGGTPAFLALVPTAALTYLATWASWFAHPGAYRRQWAADLRAAGQPVPRDWLPDALNSWWEYHLVMWRFHTTLESDHAYEAHPAGWLLQLRPTSFYWPDPAPPPQACGAERCVQAITSVGNPVLWWLGAAAVLVVAYLAVRRRDWRAWAVLAGYAAMYLPWLGYAHRTIFTFYAVAVVPFVVLALVLALGWAAGILAPPGPAGARSPAPGAVPGPAAGSASAAAPVPASGSASAVVPGPASGRAPSRLARFVRDDGAARVGAAGWALLGLVVTAALAAAVFFWPVWTGATISYDAWRWRMWLPSWV